MYRILVTFVTALAIAGTAAPVQAQTWPSRTIRLIVPAAAGGTVDLLARAVSVKLGDLLGQTMIVENRPGASTSIAEEYVVRQAPDGYTLLMSGITLATQPFMRANLPYDPQKDFTMISLVATSGNVIVVNPAVPVKTVNDLIQLAKSSPTPLYYGTPAFGATGHLAAEMFNQMAGTKLRQVPYKGAAPALQDLIGGQIHMTFDNIPAAINFVRSGKIRAVAVTTAKRDRQLPDVPTIAESGLPGYEIVAWFGMVAPAKLPREISGRLHAEIVKALKDPVVLDRLARIGFEPVGSTPAEFLAYVKAESDKLGKVIKAAGMKPQ
ncbi:MAG: tripartite tricarboxylate transporter substrate binding protein [Betaproteobacteria bacterium]|nr:tripartite tricarboxylate transporter substrate binding protein [Betaproteobacteria bacterium]